MRSLAMCVVAISAVALQVHAGERVQYVLAIGSSVTGTFPSTEATIPTNGRLVVLGSFRGNGLVTFARVHDDGTRDVLTAAPLASDALVVALGDEVPGETINVDTDCAGCTNGDAGDVSFLVGPGADNTPPTFGDAADAAVSFTATSGGFPPTDTGFAVTVTDSAIDDGGAVAIEMEPDEAPATVTALQSGVVSTLQFQVADKTDHRTCATLIALDIAGNESDSKRVCADLAHPSGCASSSSPAPLAWLALALRRRSARRLQCRHVVPLDPRRA